MSMSRDRVRFVLDVSNACAATRKAFQRAFGQSLSWTPGACVSVKTIICRPSQFARFLIYRNEEGGRNGFKMLEATLFTPTMSNLPIDVSKNPSQE
jgi:hypothetical protein